MFWAEAVRDYEKKDTRLLVLEDDYTPSIHFFQDLLYGILTDSNGNHDNFIHILLPDVEIILKDTRLRKATNVHSWIPVFRVLP